MSLKFLESWHDWLFNAVLLFTAVSFLVLLYLRKGLRQRPKLLMLILCAVSGAEFARDLKSSRGDLSTYLAGVAFIGFSVVTLCIRQVARSSTAKNSPER